MKELFINNWFTLLIAAIFLFYVVYLVVNKKWTKLRVLSYTLIKRAEELFQGSKRGQEKFNFVFDRIYSLIPAWLRFFVTEDYLKRKLQKWYNDIKDYLEDGKIDNISKDKIL